MCSMHALSEETVSHVQILVAGGSADYCASPKSLANNVSYLMDVSDLLPAPFVSIYMPTQRHAPAAAGLMHLMHTVQFILQCPMNQSQ